MTGEPIIFVVDDDADVRDSIEVLLVSAGFKVRAYAMASSFLDDLVPRPGCLIVDIRMPGMDGLELQDEIKARGIDLPVIVMTGHGDVPLAVRAMKAGAIDFLEKPFEDATFLHSIQRALEIGRGARSRAAETSEAKSLLSQLTPREKEVLSQIIIGHTNKVAAFELGISPRTIEIHRAHIMDKMNAKSLSDLVRAALAAGSSALSDTRAA